MDIAVGDVLAGRRQENLAEEGLTQFTRGWQEFAEISELPLSVTGESQPVSFLEVGEGLAGEVRDV